MSSGAAPEASGVYKLERGGDVTKVGAWLRAASLDELPAAPQRRQGRHVARRAPPVPPLRDGAVRSAPVRALPYAGGADGPLAGDGEGALDVLRGARPRRRLRAWLVVAASTSRCSPVLRSRCSADGERHEPAERVRTPILRRRSASSASATGGRISSATCTSSTKPRSWPCAISTPQALAEVGARYPAMKRTTRSRSCSPTPTSRPSRSRPRRDAPPARRRSARGGQARVRREAARRLGRRGDATSMRLAERARARRSCPGTRSSTARRSSSSATDPDRRARRDLLHLDEPREPRPAPARRQRRLGSRAARLFDPPLLARRAAVRVSAFEPRLRHPDDRPTSPSSTSRSRRARSRTSSSHGSRRASCAEPRSSAREDGRLRRHEHRAGSDLRLRGDACPTRLRSASSSCATEPETSSPRASTPAEPLLRELEDFRLAVVEGLTPRSRRAARAGRRPNRGGRGALARS